MVYSRMMYWSVLTDFDLTADSTTITHNALVDHIGQFNSPHTAHIVA